MLSWMIYLLCIIDLQLVLLFEQYNMIANHIKITITYHCKFLIDNSASAFIKLHLQCMYAKIVSQDYYMHLTVLWAPDHVSLQYKSSMIIMIELKKWFQEMLKTANQLLYCQLVFCDESYLEIQNSKFFTDNMIWTINRKFFVNIQLNCLTNEAW